MANVSTLPPSVNLQDNLGPQVNLSISIIAVLSTVAIVLRLVTRHLKRAALGASDYTIIVGWLAAWGITALVYVGVTLGLGKHVGMVPPENTVKLLQVTMATEILYCITLIATKISLLLLYRSIFPGRGFAITTNIVGGFVVAWGTACLLVSIFSCKPVQGFWDITIPSTYVVILTLPMKKIWNLQMSLKQKLAVSGMFLLGGFVCVSSGVRLYFLLGMNQQDFTWSYYGAAVWSVVEVNMAVISACLPTIRPVLQHTLPKLLSLATSRGSTSNKGDQGYGSSQYPDTHALNRMERDHFEPVSDAA